MKHDANPMSGPSAAAEHEWQAQERARQAERDGIDLAAGDAAARHYRLIAQALRQPPAAQLPAGFAQRTARRIASVTVPDTRVERYLIRGLVAVFVLAADVVAAVYGRDWLPAVTAGVPTGWLANPSLLALVACLGLSGLVGRWQAGPRASG